MTVVCLQLSATLLLHLNLVICLHFCGQFIVSVFCYDRLFFSGIFCVACSLSVDFWIWCYVPVQVIDWKDSD